MDFLDPKRKKAQRHRLLLGYVLMAVAIALATFILLLTAYGYDIDRKTGGVIQNGIVYVDSRPGGAQVYVNGKRQSSDTATRLNLPAAQYTLRLEKDGYKTWTRTFFLDGGQIQRLVYPLLIPKDVKITDLQLYGSQPSLATQSPDRHWLLVQQPGQTYAFDQFDSNNPAAAATTVTIPSAILSEPTAAATVTVVEWSNDNRHFLVERKYGDAKHEFLMVDRQSPDQSLNINTALGASPVNMTLRDKKPDVLYFIDGQNQALRSGNTKDRTITAPLVSNVLAYKSYGNDIVLYATSDGVEADRTQFKILEGGKSYSLKAVPKGLSYLVEVSKYNDKWYYVVGSSSDDSVFVYKNPLDTLKGQSGNALSVATVLRVENPQFVSFSASVQFIAVQSGKNVMTYDIDEDRQFTIKLAQDIPLTQQLEWMDASRLAYINGGKSYITDFDGSNRQQLIPASDGLDGPFFDRDYENVMTIAPSTSVTGRFALTNASLVVK